MAKATMSLTWADIVKETSGHDKTWADQVEDESEDDAPAFAPFHTLKQGRQQPKHEGVHTEASNIESFWQDPLDKGKEKQDSGHTKGDPQSLAFASKYEKVELRAFASKYEEGEISFADAVRGQTGAKACSQPESSFSANREHDVGAPIGIRAIQSILMSATQTNLSHFHTAGMEDERAGVLIAPSTADTLNCVFKSHNTSMTFMTDVHISDVRKSIVYSDFDPFVTMVRTNFTELPDRENVWYEASKTSDIGSFCMYDGTILRFYVDYKRLKRFGLTLSDIGKRCFGDMDCQWAVSPDFMGMIDVGFSSNYIAPMLSRLKCQVCGTKDVVACEKIDEEGHIVTTGSNIIAASKILKGSYKATLKSNNVTDLQRRFGIEAAARVLEELIGSVIVSDFMTRTGEVVSFSKHSIEVSRKGLLTSMGFERPKEDIKRELTAPSPLHTRSYFRATADFAKAGSVCKGLQKKSRVYKYGVYDNIIIGTDPNKEFEILPSPFHTSGQRPRSSKNEKDHSSKQGGAKAPSYPFILPALASKNEEV
jgi:hypothetical protein